LRLLSKLLHLWLSKRQPPLQWSLRLLRLRSLLPRRLRPLRHLSLLLRLLLLLLLRSLPLLLRSLPLRLRSLPLLLRSLPLLLRLLLLRLRLLLLRLRRLPQHQLLRWPQPQ
jgi:hypothetical protein